jgi:hypothetical protein
MTISGANQSVTIVGTLTANGSSITPSQWTTSGANISYTTGNVGIGTSSPTNFASATTLTVNNAGDGVVNTQSNGTSGLRMGSGASSSYLFEARNLPMRFLTNSTEQMRIVAAGDVGIGTSTPKVRLSGRNLSINGDSVGENYQSSIELLNNNASAGEIWTNTSEMVIGAFGAGRPLSFRVQNNTRGQFDTSGNFLFNSGYGSDPAIAYGCRAWVNFNGTGTVAIRGQGNVTSITDNGTGDYTVNFTRSMPDVNYCVGLTADFAQQMVKSANTFGGSGTNPTTSSIRVFTRDGGSSASDASHVYVSIFR